MRSAAPAVRATSTDRAAAPPRGRARGPQQTAAPLPRSNDPSGPEADLSVSAWSPAAPRGAAALRRRHAHRPTKPRPGAAGEPLRADRTASGSGDPAARAPPPLCGAPSRT